MLYNNLVGYNKNKTWKNMSQGQLYNRGLFPHYRHADPPQKEPVSSFFVEIVKQCSETNEKLIFSAWAMVDFVKKILRKLNTFEYKINHRCIEN